MISTPPTGRRLIFDLERTRVVIPSGFEYLRPVSTTKGRAA
jgi:hypothetical protein